MIQLEINGIKYYNFTSAEVGRSLDNFAGSFSVEARTDSTTEFPFSVGSACRVFVAGELFMTGFLEVIETSYGSDSHVVSIQGRDKTCDLLDSAIGEDVNFEGGISLVGVIKKIISPLGVDIGVINSGVEIDTFTKDEKISSEIGATYFDVIEVYCRKKQVFATTNPDGDIVLFRGSSSGSDFALVNNVLGNAGNIVGASFKQDHSNRFNEYEIKSGLNVSLLNLAGDTSAEATANTDGKASDEDIRATRKYVKPAEKSSSDEQCEKRAVWQANINRSRSLTYTATVFGHRNANNDQLWELNTLVDVDDDFAGAHGKFLVNSLTFKSSEDSGNVTEIGMVSPDAYQLIASEPVKQKKTNALGGLS